MRWRGIAVALVACAPACVAAACGTTGGGASGVAADAGAEADAGGGGGSSDARADDEPQCSDATAPLSCGRVTDLPDGALTDALSFPLPDGGTSPPRPGEQCSTSRRILLCTNGGGANDDPTTPIGCENQCCDDEYGLTCNGQEGFDAPPECREVVVSAGFVLFYCCKCR